MVVLDPIGDAGDAAHVAINIMEAIAAIGRAGGVALKLTTSIGISLYPNDGPDVETLLHRADVAMYHAKQGGRQGYRFYSPEMNAHVRARMALESRLAMALSARQFELEFMPALDIATGKPTCREGLLRWLHPELGRLLPHEFLPVAEESGMIIDIGRWVLHHACARARLWLDGGDPVRVSVNIAAAQLADRRFADDVMRTLAEARLPAHMLELELREALVLAAAEDTHAMLRQLRGHGVHLSLDNFGAGTASLSALRKCPFNRIKIDRSLVGEAGNAIVPAIIAMGRSLNLRVLAEGVENETQLHILRQLKCDEYQGRLALAQTQAG